MIFTVGSIPVHKMVGTSAGDVIRWVSGMVIDADGDPRAYNQDSGEGDDRLGNAGGSGDWFGVVTDTGKPSGTPLVQGPADPAPGFYVSPTAYRDHRNPNEADPRRYVNSAAVPYISVPPELTHAGVTMGDLVQVCYAGRTCAAVVGDVGPRGKIGEGSIALADALGIDSRPRNGGCDDGVEYAVFLGTSATWPRALGDIQAGVDGLISKLS